MNKKEILKIANLYDIYYRGGVGRGDIDEELAILLAWAWRQEKAPSQEKIIKRIQII